MAGKLERQMVRAFYDSDLSDSPLEETSIERIGALGLSDTLGAQLWRLRWGNDHSSYASILTALVRHIKTRPHGGPELWLRVCVAAINEWLFDACPTCNGRGVTVFPDSDQVHRSCPTCLGTLIRRSSDSDRAKAMRWSVETQRKWNIAFSQVHEAIAAADAKLRRQLNAQLERVK